jgi:hypothetical protein
MAIYVELPLGADLLQDRDGNLQSGATATVVLRGTATPATHAKSDGTTATTGGLIVRSDGSIGSTTERRYFQAGIPVDVTIAGRTRRVEPVAAATSGIASASGLGVLFREHQRFDAAAAQTVPIGDAVLYIDPTILTASLRMELLLLINSTAPACNISVALQAVSAPTGAAGVLSLTQGSTVSGSTITATTPAANSSTHTNADFTTPAAGWYAVIVTTSGAMAAASSAYVGANIRAV